MKKSTRNRARIQLHVFNAMIAVLTMIGMGAIIFKKFSSGSGFSVTPSGMNLRELTQSAGISVGSDSAPVVVRVFGAYHCPHCWRFESTVGKRLRELAVQGKIRYVYIHGSTDMKGRDKNGAVAAYCAEQQGKSAEMRDVLYRTWSDWGRGTDPAPKVAGYAASLGIEGARFRACVASPRSLGMARRDRDVAERVGIDRVPTVFVDNDRVELAGAYSRLIQLVEQRVQDAEAAPSAGGH